MTFMQVGQMGTTSWNENTGEPRVWKLTRAVRGRAGGKGPSSWYLACCLSYYELNEPLPNHSSLTRIRERYGVEVLRRFFEAIVDQCQQAGLVWGKELYVDARHPWRPMPRWTRSRRARLVRHTC